MQRQIIERRVLERRAPYGTYEIARDESRIPNAGDLVEVEIEKVGRLRNFVRG